MNFRFTEKTDKGRGEAGDQQTNRDRERDDEMMSFCRDALCSRGSDCAEAVGVMQSQLKK